jgi:2,3-bisphosphoglycerate-independent phosphoglycerate mutase
VRTPARIILLFVDGLGWGEADPRVNPCLSYGGEFFRLPAGPDGPVRIPAAGWARPIDPLLGIGGIPQSATGQTSLLTGENAQRLLGRHLTGFPDSTLRELLLQKSLLKTLTERGRRAVFLNAYRPLFFQLPREQQLRMSATTVANLAAGLPFFTLADLSAGRCLYQEFTNNDLRDRGFDVPAVTPAEAGRILARRSRDYDFLLFEYFQTDRAGHAQDPVWARRELEKLDAFLASVLWTLERERLLSETLLLLTSDHGNLEDITIKQHTCHPVPLMAWGAGAGSIVEQVGDIAQVAAAVAGRLAPAA